MKKAYAYSRSAIYLFSLLLSAGICLWAYTMIPEGTYQIIFQTRMYALISVAFLYMALLASPFTQAFHTPFNGLYIYSRRALGVSAFYFGLLHACVAFFEQLGGFSGLGFLNDTYLTAISLSATALLIMTMMAGTSFDGIQKSLGYERWKMLHRFIYLAGLFILIHALMLGTHFANLSGIIPQVFFIALTFLLVLEGRRFDVYLRNKLPAIPQFGPGFISVLLMITIAFISIYLPQQNAVSFGIHSQHIQIAKDAQTSQPSTALKGDKSKRYTVSFNHPDEIKPGQTALLSFNVFDASSGNRVFLYDIINDKTSHLIVVDSGLTYYSHIHPEQTAEGFSISTVFPQNGTYHLYLDFQPKGAIEQQFGFTVQVGQGNQVVSNATADTNLKKTVGSYNVELSLPDKLVTSELSIGEQSLAFNFSHADTGKPVTTLEPYLASFGHLVMINQSTYEYIHVHSADLSKPAPGSTSGPMVKFIPLGLYGPIKPGIYRIFGQFNPDGKLIMVDYTIRVY